MRVNIDLLIIHCESLIIHYRKVMNGRNDHDGCWEIQYRAKQGIQSDQAACITGSVVDGLGLRNNLATLEPELPENRLEPADDWTTPLWCL